MTGVSPGCGPNSEAGWRGRSFHRSPQSHENSELANTLMRATNLAADSDGCYDMVDFAEALLNSPWLAARDAIVGAAALRSAADELIARLDKANDSILVLRDDGTRDERTRRRLEGKAEGVRLARSYVDESVRADRLADGGAER